MFFEGWRASWAAFDSPVTQRLERIERELGPGNEDVRQLKQLVRALLESGRQKIDLCEDLLRLTKAAGHRAPVKR